jgi:phosphoribosyl 1,2-cyclic phosphodiesterase
VSGAPEQLSLEMALRPRSGIASLGSGSGGNGTLVALADSLILIDCGFTLRETEARLRRLSVEPSELTAVLVTHEHADHVAGVARLARRHGLPVFATHGTIAGSADWRSVDVRTVASDGEFVVGEVRITPVPVPHDAREPTQFVLAAGGRRLGVLTDLGEITDGVVRSYAGCDALLVEANHDRDLLWHGRYPWPLKRRIGSAVGHLANEQTLDFLSRAELPRSCAVIVGHLSRENNSPARVGGMLEPLRRRLPRLTLADQDRGAGWQPIL